MKLSTLDDATIIAVQKCFKTKCVVDVYRAGKEFGVMLEAYRNSKKFVKRMSYEKGNVIIKDMEGKTLDTVQPPKKVSSKPAGKTTEAPKQEKV